VASTGQLSRAHELLAESGLRSTRQRATVLAELLEEPDDVTAQQLHERLRARGERLGLATVYRTLGLLAEEGVVDVLSHRPGELCYRRCAEGHHHHLVCSQCHRVVERARLRGDRAPSRGRRPLRCVSVTAAPTRP
jgi:Fur family transcriptional regulator, ferric uptake regulator